jgi:hypothetical protein
MYRWVWPFLISSWNLADVVMTYQYHCEDMAKLNPVYSIGNNRVSGRYVITLGYCKQL